jgi:hypothetical protein
MKFPVLFRVFASLNILGFLALLTQTALFFSTTGIGLPAVSLSIIATIWVLVTSFLWFFASRYSYPLLYLTALILAAMAAAVMMVSLRQQNTSAFFNIFYGAVVLIYCIFLLVSCFYKPIREWQKNEGKAITLPFILFGVIVAASFGGTIFLNIKLTKYQVLDVYTSIDPYNNNGLIFNLSGTTETDAIVISTNYDVQELSGRLYFADNYEAKEEKDFFRVENVRFKTVTQDMLAGGESFYIGDGELTSVLGCTFQVVKAKKVIFVLDQQSLPTDKSFVFTTLHSKKLFDEYTDRYAFVEAEAVEEAYEEYDGGDAAYYESEAEAQELIENKDLPEAIPLSVADRKLMINDFFQELVDTYDDSRYYFNTDVPRVILKTKPFGFYNSHQYVFRYKTKKLLYNQLARYNAEDENDYSFNDLVWKVSGKGLSLNLEDQELPFYGLNPAAIMWFRDYLLPAPDEEYMGQSAQTIYNGMFRRAMWQLATAREYFKDDADYDRQAEAYLDASREEGFYGPGYLYKTYLEGGNQDPVFSKMYNKFPATDNEYFYFTEEVAIGFWLRRRLDGSDAEVWKTVKTILEKYDDYPFE